MNPQAKSAALGAASGARSSYGLAAVSLTPPASGGGALGALTGDRGRRIMTGLAGTETLLDKLPMMPSRLRPPALLTRLVCGASAAALVAQRDGGVVTDAAKAGAAAAATTAVVGALWRRFGIRGGRHDFAHALVEDLLAATAAGWGARPGGAASL